jgi:hypothetical protein
MGLHYESTFPPHHDGVVIHIQQGRILVSQPLLQIIWLCTWLMLSCSTGILVDNVVDVVLVFWCCCWSRMEAPSKSSAAVLCQRPPANSKFYQVSERNVESRWRYWQETCLEITSWIRKRGIGLLTSRHCMNNLLITFCIDELKTSISP